MFSNLFHIYENETSKNKAHPPFENTKILSFLFYCRSKIKQIPDDQMLTKTIGEELHSD